MRNLSEKSCTENQNTHFVFNNFFRKSCRLGDNVEKIVERGRPQIAIWCISFWISKATCTHSEYVILYCFFSTAMVTRNSPLLLYKYIVCLSVCLSVCDRQFVAAQCRSSDNKRSQASAVCFAAQNIDTA